MTRPTEFCSDTSTFLIDSGPPLGHLTFNRQNILFVNHVNYLCVIFDKRITWRLHIGMTEAKAFRIFIIIYSLFKCERLRTNIKLTFHKTLVRLGNQTKGSIVGKVPVLYKHKRPA
jgi:hypothetical protein